MRPLPDLAPVDSIPCARSDAFERECRRILAALDDRRSTGQAAPAPAAHGGALWTPVLVCG